MVNGLVPDIGLQFTESANTRSGITLRPLPIDGISQSLKTKQRRSILYDGVNLFNSIPSYLRNIKDDLPTFKKYLDKFLLQLLDQPPVPGLVPEARDLTGNPSNCIKDWIRCLNITIPDNML